MQVLGDTAVATMAGRTLCESGALRVVRMLGKTVVKGALLDHLDRSLLDDLDRSLLDHSDG
jgi:hypothetical protein